MGDSTTIMQTIQCPRCRHIFLSYAAACPECGLPRPRGNRPRWIPCAAVIVSCLALAATVWMAKTLAQQDDAVLRKPMATQTTRPVVATSGKNR